MHIGLLKTGTTALQNSAAQLRTELLDHGVRYPGRVTNHREPVAALMGRGLGALDKGGYLPSIRVWRRLMAEVERDEQRRIWISHEFACESDDEVAARFVDELGERLHVVITLRGFADLLGSSWQQYVKSGYRHPFNRWLRKVLAEQPSLRTTPTFHRRNDQAAVVERWARIAGPDNVTVVIGDKTRPRLLTDSFEQMLGLPDGMLQPQKGGGLAANRALSVAEVELIRRLNARLHLKGVSWPQYATLVRNGAIARLLEGRVPGPAEGKLQLPVWAAEPALLRARGYADAIAASGVRVIGDLAVLYAPVATVANRTPPPEQVPADAAADALAGVVSAATGQGPSFEAATTTELSPMMTRLTRSPAGIRMLRATHATADLSSRDLAAALGLRAVHRIRSLLGR